MVETTTDHNGAVNENPDILPFSVEVADGGSAVRVLARAASATLAQAIFSAARMEYPNRRILLKRAGETISDSAGLSTPA
jgi:hypothetical protein